MSLVVLTAPGTAIHVGLGAGSAGGCRDLVVLSLKPGCLLEIQIWTTLIYLLPWRPEPPWGYVWLARQLKTKFSANSYVLERGISGASEPEYEPEPANGWSWPGSFHWNLLFVTFSLLNSWIEPMVAKIGERLNGNIFSRKTLYQYLEIHSHPIFFNLKVNIVYLTTIIFGSLQEMNSEP